MPGWHSAHRVKAYRVNIVQGNEVLDGPDENFWTKVADTIPGTPGADMQPGRAGTPMVPGDKRASPADPRHP